MNFLMLISNIRKRSSHYQKKRRNRNSRILRRAKQLLVLKRVYNPRNHSFYPKNLYHQSLFHHPHVSNNNNKQRARKQKQACHKPNSLHFLHQHHPQPPRSQTLIRHSHYYQQRQKKRHRLLQRYRRLRFSERHLQKRR